MDFQSKIHVPVLIWQRPSHAGAFLIWQRRHVGAVPLLVGDTPEVRGDGHLLCTREDEVRAHARINIIRATSKPPNTCVAPSATGVRHQGRPREGDKDPHRHARSQQSVPGGL